MFCHLELLINNKTRRAVVLVTRSPIEIRLLRSWCDRLEVSCWRTVNMLLAACLPACVWESRQMRSCWPRHLNSQLTELNCFWDSLVQEETSPRESDATLWQGFPVTYTCSMFPRLEKGEIWKRSKWDCGMNWKETFVVEVQNDSFSDC